MLTRTVFVVLTRFHASRSVMQYLDFYECLQKHAVPKVFKTLK